MSTGPRVGERRTKGTETREWSGSRWELVEPVRQPGEDAAQPGLGTLVTGGAAVLSRAAERGGEKLAASPKAARGIAEAARMAVQGSVIHPVATLATRTGLTNAFDKAAGKAIQLGANKVIAPAGRLVGKAVPGIGWAGAAYDIAQLLRENASPEDVRYLEEYGALMGQQGDPTGRPAPRHDNGPWRSPGEHDALMREAILRALAESQ